MNLVYSNKSIPTHYTIDQYLNDRSVRYHWVDMEGKTALKILSDVIKELDEMSVRLNFLDEIAQQVEFVLRDLPNCEDGTMQLQRARERIRINKNVSKKKQVIVFQEQKKELKDIIMFDILPKLQG